jgi:hypothetical protein
MIAALLGEDVAIGQGYAFGAARGVNFPVREAGF